MIWYKVIGQGITEQADSSESQLNKTKLTNGTESASFDMEKNGVLQHAINLIEGKRETTRCVRRENY